MDALARPPRRHGRDRPVVLAAPRGTGSDLSWPHATLHLHFACESRTTRRLALTLDSLVRVSRRVGRVADATTDPGRATAERPPTAGLARAPRTVLDARRDLPADARGQPRPAKGKARTDSQPRSAAGPRRTRAVTPPPKRGPPSRGASGRLRTGRGLLGTLVRWSGVRATTETARERPHNCLQRASAPN